MFTPLHSSMNQELFEKYVCNQSSHYEKYDGATCPSYRLKLKYPFLYQLCLTRYAAVQIKNWLKSTSVIKVATIQMILHKGSHHVQTPNQQFTLSAKMNGTQRRTVVSPWRIHCKYCGMPNVTSCVEATSNSENIKPVALAVIKLCLTEGISQAVSQLNFLYNSVATFWKHFGLIWKLGFI